MLDSLPQDIREIGKNIYSDGLKEADIRKSLNDCIGRQIADQGRRKAGLKTSRLFGVKARIILSNDYKEVISVNVKKAREWL